MTTEQDHKAASEPPLDCSVGRCSECGKSSSDGWALYCVECFSQAERAELMWLRKLVETIRDRADIRFNGNNGLLAFSDLKDEARRIVPNV